MSSVVLTRQIQVYVDEPDDELRKGLYQKLRDWQRAVRTAANLVVTHLYTLDRHVEYTYLVDEVKWKLADRAKDLGGILTTSHQNTAYRILSEKFKGEVPMAIMGALANQIVAVYKKERLDYFSGRRSLRSYRADLPIPLTADSIRNFYYLPEKQNFNFEVFGVPFQTRLGTDRSHNRVLLERVLSGENKLCGSQLTFQDGKLVLFVTLRLPVESHKLNENREVRASLSVDVPITAHYEQETLRIGTKEDFLYKRLQIQQGLKRLQGAIKESKGGRGRAHKLKPLARYHEKEANFINTVLHTYSRKLIQFCVDRKAKRLVLIDQKEKELLAKDDSFVLRNWSYYGLIEKITYKAHLAGIELVVE